MKTENAISQYVGSLPRSFAATSTFILASLTQEYLKLHPDKTVKYFLETVVKPVEAKRTFTGADTLIQLQRAYEEGVDSDFESVPFVITLAFWTHANRSYSSGLKEEGWSFMTEAMWWLSITLSKDNIKNLALKGMMVFESKKASSGGQARAHKSANVKKRIAELVVEKRPPNGWQSAAGAAKVILAEEKVKKMMSEEAGLKADRFNKTVEEWLGKMPEFIYARRTL